MKSNGLGVRGSRCKVMLSHLLSVDAGNLEFEAVLIALLHCNQ